MAVPQDVFPELSSRDWDSLSKPYSKIEIDEVVTQMHPMKAPSPDGFQALFYQKNWDLIANNVYSLVLEALSGKGLPQGLNETFIALIPKLEHPETVS